jgi:putative endonuclease
MTRREPDDNRRAAEKRGRRSEIVAAAFLMAKGYRLLARRFRTPVGEIDLVMRRGRTIVFVEVKRRSGEAEGLEAVGPKSRRRIARAAEYWLAGKPAAAGLDLRFDIVVALPNRLPRHLMGAFDVEGRPW